ncbi:hypothetical protein FOZ60_002729 [Perkinsus olseni]|uniref:Glutamine amidotransferase type-2 domain-containing protein n=2 Tax=Perkinsus olseni TaxID=32597 RepID=A0A7J6PJ97_PEROL|nr:hypothetical protein FOZ60_002729 [Perkinsus olseni]
MCSFLVSTWLALNTSMVNKYMHRRGPDSSLVTVWQDQLLFLHNLLSLTGAYMEQPVTSGSVAAVFNGEIYNYPELHGGATTDTASLIPAYQHLGEHFPRLLDGEFALALADLDRARLILSSDVFGTKPLYYSATPEDGVHAATYSSALKLMGLPERSIRRVPPNTYLVISLETYQVVGTHQIYEFDLRQHKRNCDDWLAAFTRAVAVRVGHSADHRPFIGLSSGVDSGAIYLAMAVSGLPIRAYTIAGEEDMDVLLGRLSHPFNNSLERAVAIELSVDDFEKEREFLTLEAEPVAYEGINNWAGGSIAEDPAASGFSFIGRLARQNGELIYLSGTGSDEIISDYGFNGTKLFPHSTFGGLFPEHLHDMFPWESVFLGTQRDYLMKEEIVAGAHGIESRYPFLDRRVVQEFLWLDASVKNAAYKSCVSAFLDHHDFPKEHAGKRGFAASKHLRIFGLSKVDHPANLCLQPPGCLQSIAWMSLLSSTTVYALRPEVGRHKVLSVIQDSPELLHDNIPSCLVGQLALYYYLHQEGSLRIDITQIEHAVVQDISWARAVNCGWPIFQLLSSGGSNVTYKKHDLLDSLLTLKNSRSKVQTVVSMLQVASKIRFGGIEDLLRWAQEHYSAVGERADNEAVLRELALLSRDNMRANYGDIFLFRSLCIVMCRVESIHYVESKVTLTQSARRFVETYR